MSALAEALAGIKIIDLTNLIAGPTVGRLFGELGADVIHVESPRGDDGRNTTTPFLGSEGSMYSVANRSKRGIVVDLKHAEGRELVRTLVRDADVFVQNMMPGALDAMDLGPEQLRALNPRLIYVSISAWGTAGPLASAPGYDLVIQAFSGAMRRPSAAQPPIFGAMVGDPIAPLIAAFATMVALRKREATGEGAHITTSLLQGALHLLATGLLVAEEDTTPPSSLPSGVPGGTGVFLTSDGLYSVVCAWNERQFQRLCAAAGLGEFADDPAHATRFGRQRAAAPLNEAFGKWMAGMTRDELLATLRNCAVPCAPVYNGLRDLVGDPHTQANRFVVPVDHPTKGRLWQVDTAFELNGERGAVRPAPLLGEHTDAVLGEHGFDEEAITALRAAGVVA